MTVVVVVVVAEEEVVATVDGRLRVVAVAVARLATAVHLRAGTAPRRAVSTAGSPHPPPALRQGCWEALCGTGRGSAGFG